MPFISLWKICPGIIFFICSSWSPYYLLEKFAPVFFCPKIQNIVRLDILSIFLKGLIWHSFVRLRYHINRLSISLKDLPQYSFVRRNRPDSLSILFERFALVFLSSKLLCRLDCLSNMFLKDLLWYACVQYFVLITSLSSWSLSEINSNSATILHSVFGIMMTSR